MTGSAFVAPWSLATAAHVAAVLQAVDDDPTYPNKVQPVGDLGPLSYHFWNAVKAHLVRIDDHRQAFLTDKGRLVLAAAKAST